MRVCKFAANLSFVKLQKRKTLHIVLSCLSERCSERGKKTRQTEEEVGRQHQGLDRPGVRQVPESDGEQNFLFLNGGNWL